MLQEVLVKLSKTKIETPTSESVLVENGEDEAAAVAVENHGEDRTDHLEEGELQVLGQLIIDVIRGQLYPLLCDGCGFLASIVTRFYYPWLVIELECCMAWSVKSAR